MATDLLAFNGVNGSTGGYLLDPMTPQQLAELATGEPVDDSRLGELRWRQDIQLKYRPMPDVDPRDLSQTGWGVLFTHDADPAIKEALGALLAHRREQAAARNPSCYREFEGPHGYRPGESKNDFLARHGAAPGPVVPCIVPYYLLIVGGPDRIPYAFQSDLDVAYAVGRIDFDTPEEYARYARSVVEAEAASSALAPTAAFFGVANQGDPATELSAASLVEPLADEVAKARPDWRVDRVLRGDATRARLARLLGEQAPSLLFTASHGVGFDLGDPRQLAHQGALLCDDWPGPAAWGQRPITEDCYLAGDHLADKARLLGLVTFHFACYGAGTPRLDAFAHRVPGGFDRAEIAPRDFVAGLPKRLLAHPRGGAVAVVGHVERAWGTSFLWETAGPQRAVFLAALQQVMDGYPVGAAIEYFNERYAELSVALSQLLYDAKYGKPPDPLQLGAMWTANNDARGWSVVGDPAARLTVAAAPSAARDRRVLRPAIVSPAPGGPEGLGTRGLGPGPDRERDRLPAHPGVDAGTVDYGALETLRQAQAQLTGALQQLAEKLRAALDRALDEATSVEVATYVSQDPASVGYERGRFTQGAKLRALTRISLDGDTLACVPGPDDQVDERLWAMHLDMVDRALANRTELLKAAASVAGGLLGAARGG